ncbi:MAG TPA: hypothetical protein VMU83_15055 [Hanamia sp.]|nr:hypothetical protein [Hanamia sp.]
MHTVTTIDTFKKEVLKMATQKNATLFHCYIQGDIFKISTAKKVQEFDFSNFKSEKKICSFIDTAIQILRKHLLEQILLFSDTEFKRNSASGK